MDDLDFDTYQSFVAISGKSDAPTRDQVLYAGLKLGGEAGEVQEILGKSMRAVNGAYAVVEEDTHAKLVLELGDVLWYVAKLAHLYGVSLKDVATLNRLKLIRRNSNGKDQRAETRMAELFLGKVIVDG